MKKKFLSIVLLLSSMLVIKSCENVDLQKKDSLELEITDKPIDYTGKNMKEVHDWYMDQFLQKYTLWKNEFDISTIEELTFDWFKQNMIITLGYSEDR